MNSHACAQVFRAPAEPASTGAGPGPPGEAILGVPISKDFLGSLRFYKDFLRFPRNGIIELLAMDSHLNSTHNSS